MIAGELVLGVHGLSAAVVIAVVPGIRRLPAIARHPRARIALLTTFGVLYVVAALAGRDALAPVTGVLLVSSLLLVVVERRARR